MIFVEKIDKESLIQLCHKHFLGYLFTWENWEKFLNKWHNKKATKKNIIKCAEELKSNSGEDFTLKYVAFVIFREGIFRTVE